MVDYCFYRNRWINMKIYMIVNFIVWYSIFLLIMMVIYYCISKVLWKMSLVNWFMLMKGMGK